MSPPNAGTTAILFDLDGTLVDTVYEHVSAWATALKSEGISIPKWKIHRRIGMSGSSMVRQLIREEQCYAHVDIALLERKHDNAFAKANRDISVLPGARELLKFLTWKHIRWAVATTGGKQQTARLLKKLSIPTGVPIVTGDDVAKAKPSPDVFVLAAGRLGLPVSDCIVIGDKRMGSSRSGVQASARGWSSIRRVRPREATPGWGIPHLCRSHGHVAAYRGSRH